MLWQRGIQPCLISCANRWLHLTQPRSRCASCQSLACAATRCRPPASWPPPCWTGGAAPRRSRSSSWRRRRQRLHALVLTWAAPTWGAAAGRRRGRARAACGAGVEGKWVEFRSRSWRPLFTAAVARIMPSSPLPIPLHPMLQCLPRGVVLRHRLLARRLAGRAPADVQIAGRGTGGGEGRTAAGGRGGRCGSPAGGLIAQLISHCIGQ